MFKILNLDVTSFACDVPSSHVCDKVWWDTNGNGIQDSGENGVGGCTVDLKDANGVIIGSTTTDSNGYYISTARRGAIRSVSRPRPAIRSRQGCGR